LPENTSYPVSRLLQGGYLPVNSGIGSGSPCDVNRQVDIKRYERGVRRQCVGGPTSFVARSSASYTFLKITTCTGSSFSPFSSVLESLA
jgi:hypothetical protein